MLSTGYCSNQYAIFILDRLREKDRDTVPFDLTPNADRSPVVMPYSSPDTAAAANGLIAVLWSCLTALQTQPVFGDL
jgi:hypothetical protein